MIHYIIEKNLLVVELDRGVEVRDLGIPYLVLFVGLWLAELYLFVGLGLAESFICQIRVE